MAEETAEKSVAILTSGQARLEPPGTSKFGENDGDALLRFQVDDPLGLMAPTIQNRDYIVALMDGQFADGTLCVLNFARAGDSPHYAVRHVQCRFSRGYALICDRHHNGDPGRLHPDRDEVEIISREEFVKMVVGRVQWIIRHVG